MNDDYIKTQVMDVPAELLKEKTSASEVADKLQTTMDEQPGASNEYKFTQTYSYLT